MQDHLPECFHKSENGLQPIHCDLWQGFVFINLSSEQPMPLADYLAGYADHFAGFLNFPDVPMMFIAELEHPDFSNYNLTSLRTGIMGVVPTGCQGQILTRGYSVMKGYWNDPAKTREVIDEAGWMHTGDLGVIDAEGYCNITGRLKDMLIRGGENIFPREIEELLYRNPEVQAVQVFGVPDKKYGEEVCAWIQLEPGTCAAEQGIREFCRGQIAQHKVPRYVKFVSEFPMNVTGKAQKFIMREQMCAELGASEQRTA